MGVLPGGGGLVYPSMQWGRHPSLWTESQTGVKTLLWPKLRLRAVETTYNKIDGFFF